MKNLFRLFFCFSSFFEFDLVHVYNAVCTYYGTSYHRVIIILSLLALEREREYRYG
jgi:hypothetical protein